MVLAAAPAMQAATNRSRWADVACAEKPKTLARHDRQYDLVDRSGRITRHQRRPADRAYVTHEGAWHADRASGDPYFSHPLESAILTG